MSTLCFLEVLRSHLYLHGLTIQAIGGFIMLDTYMINVNTCSKTPQIPPKNKSSMHITPTILTFQKEKIQMSWHEDLVLKRIKFIFKLWTICMKNAPGPSKIKSCIGSKKCNTCQEQWRQYQKMHQTYTGTKKHKFLNFKVHQTSTNFRDMVAHSQVDCKCVFLFFPCAGLVRFETWTGCFLSLEVNMCLCRRYTLWNWNLMLGLCLWKFGVSYLLKHVYLICAFKKL